MAGREHKGKRATSSTENTSRLLAPLLLCAIISFFLSILLLCTTPCISTLFSFLFLPLAILAIYTAFHLHRPLVRFRLSFHSSHSFTRKPGVVRLSRGADIAWRASALTLLHGLHSSLSPFLYSIFGASPSPAHRPFVPDLSQPSAVWQPCTLLHLLHFFFCTRPSLLTERTGPLGRQRCGRISRGNAVANAV